MTEQKYASLDEYFGDIVRNFVENCTLCGECVRRCPTYPLGPLKDKTPDELLEKTINFLKEGIFSEEVLIKTLSCAMEGACSDVCPVGINPMLVNEAIKGQLVRQGKMPPEVMSFFSPEERFNLNKVFTALQIKPHEKRWLSSVPPNPKKTENVVFLGCALPGLSHATFSLLDILEKMDIEFTVLGGGQGLCCIGPFSRNLMESLSALSPKRVILGCSGCFEQFTQLYPNFLDLNFEVKHFAQYLADNMDKMKFTKPLNTTIVFHNSCGARRSKIDEPVRKILENIVGLKVVKEETACCGGVANITAPEIAQKMRFNLVENLNKAKADYVVSLCSGCQHALHSELREGSFALKDLICLVHEAMGGKEYEDKLAKYWTCGSVDELIEETRENFTESGYTEEEMRHILPLYFKLPG